MFAYGGSRMTTKEKPEQTPTYVSVKIDAEVYRLLKTVAAYRGVGVSEYLTTLVRQPVQKDFDRMKADA